MWRVNLEKQLPDLIGKREPASKLYVHNKISDPSKIRNNSHIGFNDKKLGNVRFVKVYVYPAVGRHLTPKLYVDEYKNNSTLVRNKESNDFNNRSLSNIP